ncbi:HD domain-containing protein [Baekduia soli]|uniref:HD domain-containing protein n=1 Tax=Baekduia soli TaxID=496014 RepID=A0A5B8U994_9ACTN|nr:HD domain-containing protein [Baekduia soli]QEC49575.1 HD domain-containing protein [Baekduia soli]
MRVADALHGAADVREPVLRALLGTAALQRLAGVHQAGAVWLVRPGRDVTRLQHSVGTMLLVRRLGGSTAEQAAALLHDAGHGAFSHVIDRVFDDAGDCWHEDAGVDLLRAGEVPALLAGHGLDPDAVLALHDWPLLDREAPDLCADRIDYALRDAVCEGLVTAGCARAFLDALAVTEEGTLAVTAPGPAAWFAERFDRLVGTVFCDPTGIWADWVLAGAIRRALALGALDPADLLSTDAALLDRLRGAADPEIDGALARLVPGARAVLARPGEDADVVVHPKPRTVDPLVLGAEGAPVRASALAPSIARDAAALRARVAAGIAVRAA